MRACHVLPVAAHCASLLIGSGSCIGRHLTGVLCSIGVYKKPLASRHVKAARTVLIARATAIRSIEGFSDSFFSSTEPCWQSVSNVYCLYSFYSDNRYCDRAALQIFKQKQRALPNDIRLPIGKNRISMCLGHYRRCPNFLFATLYASCRSKLCVMLQLLFELATKGCACMIHSVYNIIIGSHI